MAREPKPWYRKDRAEWCVTINGKRHRLGPDEKEAKKKFHNLMGQDEHEEPTVAPGHQLASIVLGTFLTWVEKNRASSYDWYRYYLKLFQERYPHLRADRITGELIEDWMTENEWNEPSRRAAITGLKRAYHWAARNGIIDRSPIEGVERPPAAKRKHIIKEAEYKKILAAIKDPQFRKVVEFVWLTGSRPTEVFNAKRHHVHGDRLIFEVQKSKGKKKPRIVYMNTRAEKLIKGNGEYLFTTASGRPFTKDTVRLRFRRMKKKLDRVPCLYDFRHGFCHRLLANGVDSLTVATLLGHSSPAMVATVYAHMNEAAEHLRAAVK